MQNSNLLLVNEQKLSYWKEMGVDMVQGVEIHEECHLHGLKQQVERLRNIIEKYGINEDASLEQRTMQKAYYSNSDEVKSRIMQLRHDYGISPDKILTPSEIKALRHRVELNDKLFFQIKNSGKAITPDIFDKYPELGGKINVPIRLFELFSDKAICHMLNDTACLDSKMLDTHKKAADVAKGLYAMDDTGKTKHSIGNVKTDTKINQTRGFGMRI